MDDNSRRALIAGALSALLGARATSAQSPPAGRILRLDNQHLTLTETTFIPGVPVRGSHRSNDQLILFLDDCRYEHVDPVSGVKSIRVRKSGDFIWYERGGEGPVLTNVGSKPYRTLLVELK